MKEVIYNGPSPLVKIGGYPDHLLGAVVAYPDDVADILVNQSRRQRFAFAVETPNLGVSDPGVSDAGALEAPVKRKPRKADE